MRTKVLIYAEVLVLLLTVSIVLSVVPATTTKALQNKGEPGYAIIQTNKYSFTLSETVTISGRVFQPETPITVMVSRPDDSMDSWSDVTSDTNGTFITSYTLDGVAGIYDVTATDGITTAETFFIASEWIIWTDKSNYEPEETVTIFGLGFEPDGEIIVTVSRPDNSIDTWSISADAYGNFTTTYTLDGITGHYQVTATDGTNEAITWFIDASININPSFGLPGTSVTVTGDGFYGLGGASFYGLSGDSMSLMGLVLLSGSFSVTFNVPDWVVLGQSYTVEAFSAQTVCTQYLFGGCISYGTIYHSASTTFIVPIPIPIQIMLSPSSGPPGTSVTVTGDGLWGDGNVTFDSQVMESFSADGSLSVTFNVPDWVVLGQSYTVEAWSLERVCQISLFGYCLIWEHYLYSASESFTVTAPVEGPLFSDALGIGILPLAVLAGTLVVLRRRRKRSPAN